MNTDRTIQIFDPALCCASGVCGTDVDQALVTFAADAAWASEQGASIARFNLSQQPLEFANNPIVRGFLERSGAGALPLVLVDGEMALAGRYPRRTELLRWVGLTSDPTPEAGACCEPHDPVVRVQSAAACGPSAVDCNSQACC